MITLFPLIYQFAILLTDFRAVAIRDGLTGGVWREYGGISDPDEPAGCDRLNHLAALFDRPFARR
jgi:hypothetical protein